MGSSLSQSFFIPKPVLTERNLADQTGSFPRICQSGPQIHANTSAGRVHVVTGGYAGCGLELCKILYQHNATVYIAGRNESKGSKAIAELKAAHPDSKGKVVFLKVDLS